MDKTTYGILTFLFNSYGIGAFLAGNTKKGVCTILSAIVTLGIVGMINAIKGIIAGIKILQMSDAEYAAADKESLVDNIVFFYKG